MKVTRIALFSSGVGYFERQSTVDSNAVALLSFRTEQINDILKSLVVQDLDGGSVGVVSYASQDPVAKTLRSFGVDITEKPSLAELLDQLRGEPVEIGGPRSLKGVVLGVEKRRTLLPDKVLIEVDVLNLLTDAGIQQLPLGELQGLKLANAKIDTELRKALAALAGSHDADKKEVAIHFDGQGKRRVQASYLLEAPIWKTSYRLVLSAKDKPFLQAWAIVENATEVDWSEVRLSLVSGRPISFTMDLYTPIYVPRPEEELELYASLRPPSFDAGFEAGEEMAAGRAPRRSSKSIEGGYGGAGMEMDKSAAMAAPAAPAEAMRSVIALEGVGVTSVATAQEAGELFEYVISAPVSVARQTSAMLPLVNQSIAGEKLSIYNPATHPKYPLNGLLMENTTSLNLTQGPVTVFDENVYAGDAKLPDLKPGEKRLIAYALDLAMEVMTEQKSTPDELVSMRIAKGTLWLRRKYVDERTYIVKNKADKDKTLLIEQPYSSDWTLVEPKDPYEKTQNLLRFKAMVEAKDTLSRKVRLERVADQSVMLSSLGLDGIRIYLSSPVISPEVKKALEKVVELRTDLDQATRRRGELEQQVNEAVQEQARIRENLKTLQQNTDAHQRQLTKFDDLETQIERLRGQLSEQRAQEQQKRDALEKYLLSLAIE